MAEGRRWISNYFYLLLYIVVWCT